MDTPSRVSVNVVGLREKAKGGENRKKRTVVDNETNVCRRPTLGV